jgi:hypothetical protein
MASSAIFPAKFAFVPKKWFIGELPAIRNPSSHPLYLFLISKFTVCLQMSVSAPDISLCIKLISVFNSPYDYSRAQKRLLSDLGDGATCGYGAA